MTTVEYETGGGVVIDRGKLLLLDRPQRGEVRLPKGHIDPGETACETALRETTEESGYSDLQIVADLGEQLVEFEHDGDHYRRTEHYYLMALGSQQTTARNQTDARQFHPLWLPLDEAVARLTFDAEQRVAQLAIAAYRKQSLGRDRQ